MNKLMLVVFLYILFSYNLATNNQGGSAKSSDSANIKIDKAFISIRIGIPLWTSEKRCKKVFDMFDKY